MQGQGVCSEIRGKGAGWGSAGGQGACNRFGSRRHPLVFGELEPALLSQSLHKGEGLYLFLGCS